MDVRVADHTQATVVESTVDDGAVHALYAEHASAIERYARSVLRDPDAAADVAQEVFLRLLVASRSGRMPDNPAAWMHRVAHNVALSDVRRRQSRSRVVERLATADDEVAASTEENVLHRERNSRISTALGSMAPDHRAAVLLAAEGYGSAEIGDRIGRTELATRALLCRARGRLRNRLGEIALA
jgi:RNA polymerase sigma-70 factor (ECF subfamily)